jgi:hypothetical protein
MKIDSNDKFAPHNQTELDWAREMHSLNDYLASKGLHLQRGIRLGRQVKAYNSTGVGSMHFYLYNTGGWELWLNGHHIEYITRQSVLKYINEAIAKYGQSTRRNKWTREFKALIANVGVNV